MPGREAFAAEVDHDGARLGGRVFGQDGGDGAGDDAQAAAGLGAGFGVDQAGIGEDQRQIRAPFIAWRSVVAPCTPRRRRLVPWPVITVMVAPQPPKRRMRAFSMAATPVM